MSRHPRPEGPRAVFEPTGSRRDAASTIFNLPDCRVIDAVELPDGARQVLVESLAPPGCPTCAVVSTTVHARRRQIVRDVPVAGVSDRRWAGPWRSYWLEGLMRPSKVMANALSAAFHRITHRALPRPVGSRERVTR